MTPLQVMKLGYLMRQAQKHGFTATAVELERQFDAAIMPYINYAKAVEAEEERNGRE